MARRFHGWTSAFILPVSILVLATAFVAVDGGSTVVAQESRDSAPSDADLAPPTEVEVVSQGRLANLAPRPPLTEAQRQEWAGRLRRLYSTAPEVWPAAVVDSSVTPVELGLLPEMPFPADNPYTPEKAELGKLLFFDPRLSGSGQIACATCHDPELGWGDNRSTSFGHDRQPLRRNAPSLLNVGHAKTLFWDGRAESLEAQALAVLVNRDEMRGDPEAIERAVEGVPEYRQRFQRVFGDAEVGFDEIAKALATYERTIVGDRSPFDAFLKGRQQAMSDSALIGLHLFRTQAGCMNCHHGPAFTDDAFHEMGLSNYGRRTEDLGRYKVSRDPADVGRFKTPSLRSVTSTKPYMHNGLFPLLGVLSMYNAGMPTRRPTPAQREDPMFPRKSPLLKPLFLNDQDIDDLVAFLESLEEPLQRIRVAVP
jgi:cytochrome c peroxidase